MDRKSWIQMIVTIAVVLAAFFALQTWLAPVSTRYDLPTGEYDPNLALLKIIQLID